MVHPILWKLIDGLRKVQIARDVEHEQMIAGHSPPTKKKKLVAADKGIMKILTQFVGNDPATPPQTMWEFLRGISHNYQMNP